MKDDDDSSFAELIPGVRRLRSDRVNHYAHRGSDRFETPARAIHADKPLSRGSAAGNAVDSYFNPGLQKKLQRRIRGGQVRPEDSLDLHGCRQQEALQMLDSFVERALARGKRLVVVIHGRGLRSEREAVLKPLVQRWLGSRPDVLAWCPAQARDGGAGASYVYLRAL